MRKPKPMHLWLDQYEQLVWARTIAELRDKAGGGRVFKIYVDKQDGGAMHIGYRVGPRWFSRYQPVEIPAHAPP